MRPDAMDAIHRSFAEGALIRRAIPVACGPQRPMLTLMLLFEKQSSARFATGWRDLVLAM
ncbi:uncharacterized protein PY1_contig-17-143 [Novosphingobium sp. PY1]|nr:hypothetical protein [Novosphingobium sp. PY1]GFM31446.1 uncharacterized protein PY1_contig-17-143 [Novosphingobium sp. PY1]